MSNVKTIYYSMLNTKPTDKLATLKKIMKILKEWDIEAPWGKIALISWGRETGEPVLLVHGRQDSAATFEPLLQLLPDSYHYVAFDLPCHGRSDPFPYGVMLTRLLFVAAVQAVLRHLRWKQFIYMGHSMGCEIALIFNAVHPQRISKMVLLDPGPALAHLQARDPQEYFTAYYKKYYDNYQAFAGKRIYSKQRALEGVMKARGLTAAQAQRAAARSLRPVGHDLYELTGDRRLTNLAPLNYPPDFYYQLFCSAPPSLVVAARTFQGHLPGKEPALKLIRDLERNLDNFTVVEVEGGHDVHFTNPERFIKVLCEFLDKKFECKSKL